MDGKKKSDVDVRTAQMRQRKGQLKSYRQDQELPRILIQLSVALNPFPSERPRNALDLRERNLWNRLLLSLRESFSPRHSNYPDVP